MSSLSDLLKSLGAANSEAIDLIGNAISAVADVGGVIGLIELFISNNDQANAALAAVQRMLEKNFALLEQEYARGKGDDISQRESDLNMAAAEADSVVATLKADLNAGLPWFARSDRIQKCINALDLLGGEHSDDKWTTFYPDEVYYLDNWSLAWPKPRDSTLRVFTDRYVLPEY